MTPRTTTASESEASEEPFEPAESKDDLARDVRETLSDDPRRLSPRHLYDPLGSALFDAICRLPWYRITRGEIRLLRRYATEILAGGRGADPQVHPASNVVELGPGNGEKLTALLAASPLTQSTRVHLIDISPAALADASHKLQDIEHVSVTSSAARFVTGLRELKDGPTPGEGRLVLFLGSNVGNFEPDAADVLLAEIKAEMSAGDTFLIGTDLVKPERDLLLAYDDPLGVTAAFSRNVLVRLNRELGANFAVEAFRHHASWRPDHSRIEIHLECTRDQHIVIPPAELDFTMRAGERIWTESSYKYEPEGVNALLTRAGFSPAAQWIDDDARFALTLAGVR